MTQIRISISFTLYLLIICPGCEAIQVLTAINHKPEIETPESIRHFAKKHGFDGYPILTFDASIFSNDIDLMSAFEMYNREGKFLSLAEDIPGCPDENQAYMAMRYILKDGDTEYVQDSHTIRQGVLKATNTDISKENWKELRKDTSLWELQTKTYSSHLDNYTPFFRTLEGEVVDIYSLFPEYLILFQYQMSGQSKFSCILIREKIKEIAKLNKEFGPRIQLVLVNRDEMADNTISGNLE